MGTQKTKKTTRKSAKPTAKQLAALKAGREKLAKERKKAKEEVRKELKKATKSIRKKTSKIVSSARKRVQKETTKTMANTKARLKKKGLAGRDPLKYYIKNDHGFLREISRERFNTLKRRKNVRTTVMINNGRKTGYYLTEKSY